MRTLRGAMVGDMAGPDDFHPPAWLRNRHLQSMLASTGARRGPIARRAAALIAAQREMVLDCGGGVRLQCFRSSPQDVQGSPVVLLHGWEGSAESLYVLSLGQQLFDRGFDVLRLNLRDHGETHHLNSGLFHSCLLPEVVGAMRALQLAVDGGPLRLVGFSLGGNFMLRVGAQARGADLDIAKIIAVSPVLDPSDTLRALEGGFFGYPRYFVRKWWRSLLKKQAAWPGHYDFAQLRGVRDLRRLTAELIRRFTDFGTLEEYFEGYSITGRRLAGLDVPTTIFTSLDDPIIPAGGLERLARPASLRIVVTQFGGHCGFLDRLTGPTWVERRIIAELDVAGEPANLDPALTSA